MRIAAKVGVEAERNKVLVDEIGLNLSPGEPAGPVTGAGSSGPSEGAAVSGGEDEDRLVLGCGALAGFAYAGEPVDLPPGAFAKLWFDEGMNSLELLLRLRSRVQAACRERE